MSSIGDLLPLGETQATALQPPTSPRPHATGLDQHTATSAPTDADHLDRTGDEAALGHDLPELLQQVRTNEDRIPSHRQHPIRYVSRSPREPKER